VVSRPPRITDAEYLGGLKLRLTFSDGLVRELDFAGRLATGVLESLNDHAVFSQVKVDPVAGTVEWPNGVDIDPDVLHGDQSPPSADAPVVLAEYQLRTTG
jgi:Protein of unknown function (DUF2442)